VPKRTTVVFDTDGPAADERFVREYVLPAMDRLPDTDGCRDVGFLRYGHAPDADGGEVRLHLRGDVDAVVERESDRWDELVADGLVEGWTDAGPEDDGDKFGPRGAETIVRLEFLAGHMSKLFLEEFDGETLAPVDTCPDEGPVPVGWWSLLHFLANQRGLSAGAEIDAYREGIRNRLWTVALTEGEDAAEQRIDELVDALDGVREEVASMTDGAA